MDEKVGLNCKGLGDLSGDKAPVGMYDGIMQVSDKIQSPTSSYTMPGVLNFLQTEWAKMKFERSQWEIEKSELQARIAFLQGERKGQENLKQDLVRRIKMLEYALKQERLKFQRWKHGEFASKEIEENGKSNGEEDPEEPEYDLAAILAKTTQQVAASNAKWKESRTKLRQYLQEVGFTDNVVDARQVRLRDIMGGAPSQIHFAHPEDGAMNGEYFNLKVHADDESLRNLPSLGSQSRQNDIRRLREATNNSSERMGDDGVDEEDPETRSVLDNFNFLSNEERVNPTASDDEVESALEEFDILVSHDTSPHSKVDHDAPDIDLEGQDDEYDAIEWSSPETLMRKLKAGRGAGKRATLRSMLASLNAGEDDVDISSHVENLNETSGGTTITSEVPNETADTVGRKKPPLSSPPQDWQHMLGLGDLASLTVANEAEDETRLREASSSDRPVPSSPNSVKNTVRRTWSVRYALRSHFDAVRALTFHPTEPCMISASEDGTLKLWNIKTTPPGPPVTGKKPVTGPGCDLEPCYTFRGHDSPVLCVRFADNGHCAYSSDLNGNIREWLIPERLTQSSDPETGSNSAGVEEGVDLYEPFKMSAVHGREWQATNAVWSFAIVENSLISCAADGVITVWNLTRNEEDESEGPSKIDEMTLELENAQPTSLVCVPAVGDAEATLPRVLVGLSNGNVLSVDLQEKRITMTMELTREEDESKNDALFTVNCIAIHPLTTNLVAVGYEDRRIRFFDVSDGKCIHSMVAHLDAVTCLDIDPSGLYLVSGSHDCSLRIWNFETRACIQEITSHRKKFDESIHAVAFHPSRALMSSGGADATARVFIS